MHCVERVKTICKDRKIPISKLERDLGYSNGYIGQLRKGTFPNDRLKEIAEYLEVSIDYLMTGKEKEGGETYYFNEETKKIAQKVFENKSLRMLMDSAQDATPEDIETVHSMLLALKRKERGNIDWL